jgi:hypothetical protein
MEASLVERHFVTQARLILPHPFDIFQLITGYSNYAGRSIFASMNRETRFVFLHCLADAESREQVSCFSFFL